MHVDSIRDALHKQPFQPMILQLADGRAVLIPHRDFVAISPRRVMVINSVDESVIWLEPLLIVSIEFVEAAGTNAATPNGNGA